MTPPSPIDDSWFIRPPDLPHHDSAGGIVVRQLDGAVWIALARQIGHSEYVLPKGHIDPGEDAPMAARREVEEEAGFSDLTLLADLGCRERMDFGKTAWKRTHYFLFETRQIEGIPTDPDFHPPPDWFPLADHPPLFWPEQQDLVESNIARIHACLHIPHV